MAGLSPEALQQIDELFTRRLEPIQTVIDRILDTQERMHIRLDIMWAKQLNSCKGRDEPLEPVKTKEGAIPTHSLPTIEKLLVAGNEKLPSGTVNDWNAKKSLHLIREYDPGYETDDEEAAQTSRKRRLVLSQHLGITPTQLNMAALTLNFV